jgi:aspartyl/glutamyl-tRNA(Asn/Gln) amidotransferase C subunit
MQLEDVKKLADLARIDMGEEEMKEIVKDFDPILAYVGQVQEASKLASARQDLAEKKSEDYFLHNVMREDVITNNRGQFTDKIIAEMPDTQDGFLKVKQIL